MREGKSLPVLVRWIPNSKIMAAKLILCYSHQCSKHKCYNISDTLSMTLLFLISRVLSCHTLLFLLEFLLTMLL